MLMLGRLLRKRGTALVQRTEAQFAAGIKELSSSAQHPATQEKSRLEGKVAVITGAAKGIGAATARLFVASGAKVVIADIDDESGSRLADELGPASCHYEHCNVLHEEHIARAVDSAVSRFGSLDVMYNNAGVLAGSSPAPSIVKLDPLELDYVLSVNVRGAALGVKHAARVMAAGTKAGGSIICTASIASMVAGLAFHPYTISKHALLGLVRTTACELAHFGIRVNCIAPNGVLTGLMQSGARHLQPSSSPSSLSRLCDPSSGNDLRRLLEPADIARAALFLASEDSKYISGHNLVVDGSFSTTAALNIFKGMQTGDVVFSD